MAFSLRQTSQGQRKHIMLLSILHTVWHKITHLNDIIHISTERAETGSLLVGLPNLNYSPSILSAQIWKPSSLEISKTSPFLGFFSAMLSFRFCSCWSQSIRGELKLLSSSSTALGSMRRQTGTKVVAMTNAYWMLTLQSTVHAISPS